MQLKSKISIAASALLIASSIAAEDYVSVQYIQYDEDSGRTTVMSPSIEVSKDFGADYTLKASFVSDSISGASPTWYDSSTGASAASRDETSIGSVRYGDIEYNDNRLASTIMLTTRFVSDDELSVGYARSYERDYSSDEINLQYLHFLDNSKNRSISFGASYQQNEVLVYCKGNDACSNYVDTDSGASAASRDRDDDDDDDDRRDGSSGASESFDITVVSAEVGYTQLLTPDSMLKASLFFANESGYLSNPYMNVVRDYRASNSYTATIKAENKPDTRTSYGAVLGYVSALTNTVASNTSYRIYKDNWGIFSHTIDTKLYYELSDSLTLGTGLRYYTQSAADFYNGKKDFFTTEVHASSDRRMSSFSAFGVMLSAEYKLSSALSANIGYNYYEQIDIFDASYYTIGAKYKF